MWELDHKESWEPKNWCFWTVVLEKTLESPLDNRRSNQSILKAINSEHSLQGLMLKLKLQYFGHLMRSTDLLEKTLIMGKIEGGRRRGRQRMRWLDGITTQGIRVWMNSGSWCWTGRPCMLWFHGVAKSQTQLSDWTELNWTQLINFLMWFWKGEERKHHRILLLCTVGFWPSLAEVNPVN